MMAWKVFLEAAGAVFALCWALNLLWYLFVADESYPGVDDFGGW